jgi:hypothetical protein
MSSFGAILDASVLFKAGPRDTLLRAAEKNLYRPYWTEDLLREVERNLAARFLKLGRATSEQDARDLVTKMSSPSPKPWSPGIKVWFR